MWCELVLAIGLILSADLRAAEGAPFRVIVHSDNRVESIDRARLSAIFMRRERRWSDGSEIVPIDQPPRSRVRETFSRDVHRKSVAFVMRYWHRIVFSGRGLPPETADGDEAVIARVAAGRGAIGYVSSETTLPAGVRAVPVTE
jgi:ABC-type phosphate transport system substrate-binding protein